MRQYQNPAVTMRNRLATLTEQSIAAVGCFSARVLRLLTLIVIRTFPSLFHY
jgi:hypothetical protein